jgi:DNA-binding MarR family transcriptional regulator
MAPINYYVRTAAQGQRYPRSGPASQKQELPHAAFPRAGDPIPPPPPSRCGCPALSNPPHLRSVPARPASEPQDAADRISDLALETFRLNGRLLIVGDRLVAPLGLTSARWQVLGAVAYAPHPGPVAHLARDMGQTRQNVRRIVGDLVLDGLLELRPNPHHRRAPLVVLTAKGEAAFRDVMRLWMPWTRMLAEELSPEALNTTIATLRLLRERLSTGETEDDDDGQS